MLYIMMFMGFYLLILSVVFDPKYSLSKCIFFNVGLFFCGAMLMFYPLISLGIISYG